MKKVGGGTYEVRLSARRPALWTWLDVADADARFSENFVHLRPGESFTIRVTPEENMSVAELRGRLRIRSLFDTYQAVP